MLKYLNEKVKPMQTIQIIGLGAGDIEQLSLGLYRTLTKTKQKIFTRTLDHPVIRTLEEESVRFESFDRVYEAHDQFEDVYQAIVEQLVAAASEEDVLYCVPGHPMLAERTVQLLLEQTAVTVKILGGQSYLDDLFTALKLDPIEGFSFIDATAFSRQELNYHQHQVFCQVYDQMIASELKLTLLEDLPSDYPVTIVEAVGTSEERMETVELALLDQAVELSNLTSVYLTKVAPEYLNHQFDALRDIIYQLRAPGGCPWDQKQTHTSLRGHLLEEAYELIDAIDALDDDHMVEELGDVLLQVMLHSQIGEDEGYFTIDDVIRGLTEKMIRRHPHVFGDVEVDSEEDVIVNWQKIKQAEKGKAEDQDQPFARISKSSSALLKGKEVIKILDGQAQLPDKEIVIRELDQQLKHLQRATSEEEKAQSYGALLVATLTLARYDKVNLELALTGALNEVIRHSD